jgi:hypothetical protein
VLPRRAEAWRQWLAAWLGEALTQPQGQHRRVDPAALGGHYGASAVAAACEAFYRSLLR